MTNKHNAGKIFLVGRFLGEISRRGTGNYKSNLLSGESSSGLGPRKRALLITVTYQNSKYELKGTVNDVKNMKNLLIKHFGYRGKDIVILTEKKPDPEFSPTKKNIKKYMKWLVEGCQAGDHLVFYFSGHGLRQPNFNGKEIDGFDETICPVDYLKEGMITDDEIFSTIVEPLPGGVTLHAIVDACHSGTILDLSYVYNRERKEWQSSVSAENKIDGLAISISACLDEQVAADTSNFSGNEMNGAMTYILVETVKKFPEVTYGGLLDSIHNFLEEANQEGCLPKRALKKAFNAMLLQVISFPYQLKPQLSASNPFDIYTERFVL